MQNSSLQLKHCNTDAKTIPVAHQRFCASQQTTSLKKHLFTEANIKLVVLKCLSFTKQYTSSQSELFLTAKKQTSNAQHCLGGPQQTRSYHKVSLGQQCSALLRCFTTNKLNKSNNSLDQQCKSKTIFAAMLQFTDYKALQFCSCSFDCCIANPHVSIVPMHHNN